MPRPKAPTAARLWAANPAGSGAAQWQRRGSAFFGAFCGAVTLLGLGLQMMVGNVYAIDSFIAMLIFFTAFTAVTGAIGIAGVVKLAGKNRMRKVWKYLKGRDFCKLSEIADRLRLEEKKVLRVIEKMLDLQLLPQGASGRHQNLPDADRRDLRPLP